MARMAVSPNDTTRSGDPVGSAPDPWSDARPVNIASVPSSRDYSDGPSVRPDVSAIVVVTRHRRTRTSDCRPMRSGGPSAGALASLGILPTMRIAIATDHAGFPLKAPIIELLLRGRVMSRSISAPVTPSPWTTRTSSRPLRVRSRPATAALGIVLGGSGTGEQIVANKIAGIRCVEASDPVTARLGREHNDANVLALGARIVGIEIALACVRAFIEGTFQGGRHARRVDKIGALERSRTRLVRRATARTGCRRCPVVGADAGGRARSRARPSPSARSHPAITRPPRRARRPVRVVHRPVPAPRPGVASARRRAASPSPHRHPRRRRIPRHRSSSPEPSITGRPRHRRVTVDRPVASPSAHGARRLHRGRARDTAPRRHRPATRHAQRARPQPTTRKPGRVAIRRDVPS